MVSKTGLEYLSEFVDEISGSARPFHVEILAR
jgi:hypothetical protein